LLIISVGSQKRQKRRRK